MNPSRAVNLSPQINGRVVAPVSILCFRGSGIESPVSIRSATKRQPFRLDLREKNQEPIFFFETGEGRGRRGGTEKEEENLGSPTNDSIAPTIVHTAAGGYTKPATIIINTHTRVYLIVIIITDVITAKYTRARLFIMIVTHACMCMYRDATPS